MKTEQGEDRVTKLETDTGTQKERQREEERKG